MIITHTVAIKTGGQDTTRLLFKHYIFHDAAGLYLILRPDMYCFESNSTGFAEMRTYLVCVWAGPQLRTKHTEIKLRDYQFHM